MDLFTPMLIFLLFFQLFTFFAGLGLFFFILYKTHTIKKFVDKVEYEFTKAKILEENVDKRSLFWWLEKKSKELQELKTMHKKKYVLFILGVVGLALSVLSGNVFGFLFALGTFVLFVYETFLTNKFNNLKKQL